MSKTQIEVAGFDIEYDASGGGYDWRPAEEIDCPPSIQEEIAVQIIDGGNNSDVTWNKYRATNGVTYRW